MDLGYKLRRVRRWSSVLGLPRALRFEVAWTLGSQRVHLRVPRCATPLVVRRQSSDISVFESVFVERELALPLSQPPALIIDGGANIGLSTAFLASAFPEAKIVAIEPSLENFEMLRLNTAGCPNVLPLRAGLWSHSGHLRIANPSDEAWSFRCEPAKPGDPDAFEAVSLGDILTRFPGVRCGLLKLDIEGAELEVFSRGTEWLSRVDAILVETHSPEADAAIESACDQSDWTHNSLGEKKLLIRRSMPPAQEPPAVVVIPRTAPQRSAAPGGEGRDRR